MITRKLLAALVGLSIAAGTLGTASAQTTAPVVTRSVGPSDTVVSATAAKTGSLEKAPTRIARHARMTSKTHRKHVSLRGSKIARHLVSKRVTSKQIASKTFGTKVVTKFSGKRIRVSHSLKHGTTKHV